MTPRFVPSLALLLYSVGATPLVSIDDSSKYSRRDLKGEDDLFKNDIEYWSRFIDGTSWSLSPDPTPSPPITPANSRAYDSPPPTEEPICDSQVSLTCFDANGVSCNELVSPRGECETGDNLDFLRFRLELCDCEDSSNTQTDFVFSCTDSAPLPSGEAVRVTCLNVADNNLLFSDTVQEGDSITMRAKDGDSLPDQARCSIFGLDGDLLQSLTIKMSNEDDLYLKDKYGSLTLEACNSQECIKHVSYTYTVENTGSTTLAVTKFESMRNGERESLLQEDIPFDLAPGNSRTAIETESVDLCAGAIYFTVVEVGAISQDGNECPSEADYFFPVLHGCLVDAQITCKTEDGVECSEIDVQGTDCLVEVCYEYELNNVGTGVMDITTLDRTRNEETVSLLDLLDVTSLNPGESSTVVEKETINACQDAEYSTDIRAEADPPSNQICFDEEMYKFSTAAPCEVSVELSCATVSGLNCEDIQGQELAECNCSGGCASTLVYRYTASSCVAGLNGCADSGTNELTADIVIANGNMVLFEGTVQVNDDIVVSSIECLPATMQVLVSPAGGQPPSQVLLLDSSCGGEGTSLLDNFGALEFIGYTCSDGNTHSCYAEVEFSVTTFNTGTTPQTVTQWTFDLNGELRGSGIELPTLEPNESFVKIESAEVQLCADSEYSATATIVSTGVDDDNECKDSKNIDFLISVPPAPAPAPAPVPNPLPNPLPPTNQEECIFEMDIDCIPPAGTASCNATPPPVEQCSGRPFEMGFLYNGGDCSNSWNVQEAEGKFFCNDFNGGPPIERGEKSFIVVTDLKGETIFHSGNVLVGSMFTLFDGGETFPSDQLITIYRDNSTDPNEPGALLQSIQYHSSCSSNLFLKDRFGAVQLVLWVNEDQGVISCFANQTFNLEVAIPIDIEGGPATVTGLTISSNIDPFFFNLTDKVFGIEADGGDTIQTSIAIPIDLTEKRTYNLLITLIAVTTAGQSCTATNLLTFDAGYPLPPIFPTFSPTSSPAEGPRRQAGT